VASETEKIREIALEFCDGCGVDIGCGSDKIRREAIGVDAGMDLVHVGTREWRDLSAVNVKMMIDDLSLFESNSFDYAYSSHFLEHLDDPAKMLSEMSRVVRHGGYVVIYLPDRILYTEANPEHKHMWTMDEFVKILPETLSVVKMIPKHADYSFFVAAVVGTKEEATV